MATDESPAQPRTSDIEKLQAQLERVNNANAVLKDTLVSFVQDHIQETIALRDYKRKSEPVIQAARDFLLNVKSRNVAGLDDLSCDPSLVRLIQELKESPGVQHGVNCRKAPHGLHQSGYLHNPNDDSPYDVDGVRYCGRCHYAL